MTTLTLHNLDPQLNRHIQQLATLQSQSLNKTVQQLLSKAVGLTDDPVEKRRKEYAKFCGIWTKKEFKEFEENSKDSEDIHPEDWA